MGCMSDTKTIHWTSMSHLLNKALKCPITPHTKLCLINIPTIETS